MSECRSKHEAARLNANDDVSVERPGDRGKPADEPREAIRIGEQRRDVAEQDAGLWKVGDGPDQRGEFI